MIYLVDTNVWLEFLLEQERSSEVERFLEKANPRSLALTDFSLYSIGIMLSRLKEHDLYRDFVSDTLLRFPSDQNPTGDL